MEEARYAATIENIATASPSVRRIFLRSAPMDFRPGQFIVLHFEAAGEAIERSYSLANSPDENLLELCVVEKPDGVVSPLLLAMQPGDAVEFSGPKGAFLMPKTIDTDICFICTGTGVAPFRSMIRHIFENNIPHKNIYLVFGNRYTHDLLYHEEWTALAAQNPEFHYHPVLSRETNWAGARGYVHPVYESIFADRRDARFYVCGWNTMLTEARERLKNLGYNRRQYKFEDYNG